MNYRALLQSPLIPSQIISSTQKAAHHHAPVLIQGEQGTGKELIAKLIHHSGDWRYYRFYKMDCKLLSEEAFAEQLTRLFRENQYGTIPATLYLKEVGELGQVNQYRLLELMEDGILPNGLDKRVVQNLRFIASSSENLKEKMAQGKFSKDLYHRLNTLSIHVPPLRDRTQDIPSIAQFILKEHSQKNKTQNVGISDNVLILLKSYWWPENLRELEQVILRSAIFSEGGMLMEKDLLFETDNERNAFIQFLKRAGSTLSEFKTSLLPHEQSSRTMSLFFIELVHRIKNPLVSIKTFTQLLGDKFNDGEFRDQFYRIVKEDIEKIDTVLNGLLSYIKINTPLEKKDTVHLILEEIIKRHDLLLGDKKIKIFKKFEKDLPETVVHEEQLRYIFNALLEYVLPTLPPNGSIGFLTKSFNRSPRTTEGHTSFSLNGGYIEILIVFTGYKKPADPFQTILGFPNVKKEETVELELRLLKEILQKNRGTMTLEVNEKKPRTLISLKLPVERRKLFYYPPMKA